MCYVNCDIALASDFRTALERVTRWHDEFLMIGRRWDLDVVAPVDFGAEDWEQKLQGLALQAGRQRPPEWIDYFAFRRGLYHKKIPAFVIGRPSWDNWLVWYARAANAVVVDASECVVAVHQNHDYSYHPDGEMGVWLGEEARRNRELRGGWTHFGTVENATHRLIRGGTRYNYRHWVVIVKRAAVAGVKHIWYWSLGITRPVRHAVGLRKRTPVGARSRTR
jgi:hypothetical protein